MPLSIERVKDSRCRHSQKPNFLSGLSIEQKKGLMIMETYFYTDNAWDTRNIYGAFIQRMTVHDGDDKNEHRVDCVVLKAGCLLLKQEFLFLERQCDHTKDKTFCNLSIHGKENMNIFFKGIELRIHSNQKNHSKL